MTEKRQSKIKPRPSVATTGEVDNFIAAAPDARPAKGEKKGRKQAISVTIDPALLAELDVKADRLGVSRAAAISMAIRRLVDAETKIEGAISSQGSQI